MGSRDDHGAFTLADRAVRAASRQIHRHRARPSPCAVASRRPWRSGGDAGGRYLRRLSMRAPAAKPRPMRAGSRDCDPEDGLGQGRLVAYARWQRVAGARDAGAGTVRRDVRCRPVREDFNGSSCPSTSSGCARRGPKNYSAWRTPRVPAAVWPRNHRKCFPPVAGGASSAGTLLQCHHRDGVRAGALPAGGRARVLLQLVEIPLSARVTR